VSGSREGKKKALSNVLRCWCQCGNFGEKKGETLLTMFRERLKKQIRLDLNRRRKESAFLTLANSGDKLTTILQSLTSTKLQYVRVYESGGKKERRTLDPYPKKKK